MSTCVVLSSKEESASATLVHDVEVRAGKLGGYDILVSASEVRSGDLMEFIASRVDANSASALRDYSVQVCSFSL
jgi:hypothetical protein